MLIMIQILSFFINVYSAMNCFVVYGVENYRHVGISTSLSVLNSFIPSFFDSVQLLRQNSRLRQCACFIKLIGFQQSKLVSSLNAELCVAALFAVYP